MFNFINFIHLDLDIYKVLQWNCIQPFLKYFKIMSSFFNKSFCEKILAKLVALLPLSIKSKNPIQKYPDITESYVCILTIFFCDPRSLSIFITNRVLNLFCHMFNSKFNA